MNLLDFLDKLYIACINPFNCLCLLICSLCFLQWRCQFILDFSFEFECPFGILSKRVKVSILSKLCEKLNEQN